MTSETFFGPVDNRWKKNKLVELATSLGIAPLPPNVKMLVREIKKHLAANPNLAEIPKYQGLYVYRSQNTTSRKQDKKSTDKAAEDLAESSKDIGEVLGYVLYHFGFYSDSLSHLSAFKYLADGKFTTDPPAQHTNLNLAKCDDEGSLFQPG